MALRCEKCKTGKANLKLWRNDKHYHLCEKCCNEVKKESDIIIELNPKGKK